MTDQEIVALGPAFAGYATRYRDCFLPKRTAGHFDSSCRGVLSDLPRKSVEPIARACGTAVRTLQEFLVTADWGHEIARAKLQRRMAEVLDALPDDPLGTVGVIDETRCAKKGDRTPGVRRQYLGCLGRIDNGIVTVHVGVAKGSFQALLDADLFLPEVWDADRPRCRAAGIPDTVRYRPTWQIAYDPLVRLDACGVRFDGLVFDEGYGSKVPFLSVLSAVGQHVVGEAPVSSPVRTGGRDEPRRADQVLRAHDAKPGRRFRRSRQTVGDAWWRATRVLVTAGGCEWARVAAIDASTAEVKYLVTNATAAPLSRVLAVAFRRATIAHSFRVAKSEAGSAHDEGRQWVGLVRHLIPSLVVLGFVSEHTDRSRGEKPVGDDGASVPGVERAMCADVPPPAQESGPAAGRARDPLPPTSEPTGHQVPQESAA